MTAHTVSPPFSRRRLFAAVVAACTVSGESRRVAAVPIEDGVERTGVLIDPTRAPSGVRVAAAARREGPVAIDGVLDDGAWRAAEVQAGFWQRDPHPGRAPTFATEFRVLYDDRALYVGVRAFDPEPSRIRRLVSRRDSAPASDWVSVEIDSYHDRRTAFSFAVNAAGVQRDVLQFNDVESDPSWDAIWESGTRVDHLGWTAELRIPYGQLRFTSAVEQSWGLQVRRLVHRTQELTVWSPWPKEASQEVSLYGTLIGMRGLPPARRIEVLPYLLLGAGLDRSATGEAGREGLAGAGLDLEYGLGSNFTLVGTINPDFGQVEADPSQVNLTADETFFEEKRPFFVEGTDLFRFSLDSGESAPESLFYTRRIGAPPRGDPGRAYVERPDAATIYGAAKLSGKTAGGWSLGVIEAVTGRETAAVAPPGQAERRELVEPLTSYTVARVRKDLRQGRTTVGGAATAVDRSLSGDEADWLHDQAYTGGLELGHRFGDDLWKADVRIAGSHVRGSATAIDLTQRSSVHYYQRPDAAHLGYDPGRTSLSGGQLLWNVGKRGGSPWRFATGGDSRTPGFEVNDVGFQKRADYYEQWGLVEYRVDRPGRYLRDYRFELSAWGDWDLSPQHLTTGGDLGMTVNLLNQWGGSGGVRVIHDRRVPGALRGGPALRTDPRYESWLDLWSDAGRSMTFNLSASTWWQPGAARFAGLTPSLALRAGTRLELSLGGLVEWRVDADQYVDQVPGDAGETHHVLARIRQLTAALHLRANLSFSPALSLEMYVQPFLAGGDYSRYKEVTSPQAAGHDDRFRVLRPGEYMDVEGERVVDLDRDGAADYRFGLADFNLRELRSNVVLRWQYRPGSTLFLVWSHGRTSEAANGGRLVLSRELDRLADQEGEHVILAKLSYWFGT